MGVLQLQPVTLSEARRYVDLHHRHNPAPQGGKFAIAINDGQIIRGVIICGRPVARKLDNGYTIEVTRCCTDGVKNGSSMLYAAAWRAARAMGYRRLITYTLKSEPGTSLVAAGFKSLYETQARSWDMPSRPRIDKHVISQRVLWEIT